MVFSCFLWGNANKFRYTTPLRPYYKIDNSQSSRRWRTVANRKSAFMCLQRNNEIHYRDSSKIMTFTSTFYFWFFLIKTIPWKIEIDYKWSLMWRRKSTQISPLFKIIHDVKVSQCFLRINLVRKCFDFGFFIFRRIWLEYEFRRQYEACGELFTHLEFEIMYRNGGKANIFK